MIAPADDPAALRLAAGRIRTGGLVAFPTETVYGLGCDALNAHAADRIFLVKQRPSFDPLIVHIDDRTMLSSVVATLPVGADQLIAAFWPGPLTLVLPKHPQVPDNVTAGLPTVAVRMPAHPTARALIRLSGCPIAAPSANPFGYVSPTTAQHVREGLGDQVDLVLDGGPCPIGVESTILSLVGAYPEILRPGSVSLEDLRHVLGPVVRPAGARPLSPMPGTGTRHYATRTPVTILSRLGERPSVRSTRRVGLLALSAIDVLDDRFAVVEVLSPSGNVQDIARRLFAALRWMDTQHLDHVYVEPCEQVGLGVAIMDRLRRCAAGPHPGEGDRAGAAR